MLAFLIIIIVYSNQGLPGVYAWEMSLDDAALNRTLALAGELVAILAAALAKLEIYFLYVRVLKDTTTRSLRIIYITGFVSMSAFAVIWAVRLLACIPIGATWNFMRFTGANCHTRHVAYIIYGFIGIVEDNILMIAIWNKIRSLQMTWDTKGAVIAKFSSSLFTLAATVSRLFILRTGLKNLDPTLVSFHMGFCWVIQADFIMICDSLPDFRSVIRHFVSRNFGEPAPPAGLETNHIQVSAYARVTIGGTPMNGAAPSPRNLGYGISEEDLLAP
ncbi:hypothetical protein Forpi1262_v014557 [Fusarium oxysporum f. sp. raphani]|uniref:Rhodopsin domain-containing protein n=1 Tax=Fusarium oxysporum f. sp. raphani TaxID=96318 RepID=A0A8J5PEC1_FUSOX|nr:hypothetical protein Forpi1262_v014557 [Fusarium oxysporum f. sp. raphani]